MELYIRGVRILKQLQCKKHIYHIPLNLFHCDIGLHLIYLLWSTASLKAFVTLPLKHCEQTHLYLICKR